MVGQYYAARQVWLVAVTGRWRGEAGLIYQSNIINQNIQQFLNIPQYCMGDFWVVVAGLSKLLFTDFSKNFWYTRGQMPACYLQTNMTAKLPAYKQVFLNQVKLKRCKVLEATHFHLLHGSVQGHWSYYLLNSFWSQSECPWKYVSGFDNTLETTWCNCKSNWMDRQIKVPVCDCEGVEWGQLSWSAVGTCAALCNWPTRSILKSCFISLRRDEDCGSFMIKKESFFSYFLWCTLTLVWQGQIQVSIE